MGCNRGSLIIFLVLLFTCGILAQYWPLNVVIPNQGIIQGFKDKADNLNLFYGIPYAQPPIDDLRWKPPQTKRPWGGILKANEFSSACTQEPNNGFTFPNNVTFSEDCLYLNVYAPDTPNPKPVFFWIHGGGLSGGGSSELRLRGDYLASVGDIVVVTINYRLGALGFLAHPYLLNENSSYPTTGNYGLLDQRLALQWVQSYIHLFGGDPKNVTIAGESAGGSSVSYHLVMPKSFGLYSKAIIESGACFDEVQSLQRGEQQGIAVQNQFKCSGQNPSQILNCMRAIPWKSLVSIPYDTMACIDKFEILKFPYQSFKNGEANKVPVLAGDTANEGTFWVYGPFQNPIPNSEYLKAIQFLLGSTPTTPEIIAQVYPCENYSTDCRIALSQAFGDNALTCPTTLTAQFYTGYSGVSDQVFTYLFSHHPSWSPAPYLGAYHSSEIEFVWSNIAFHGTYTPDELILGHRMSAYWISFVKTANPNFSGQPLSWPAFNARNNWQRVNFKTGSLSYLTSYEYSQCEFWATIYAKL